MPETVSKPNVCAGLKACRERLGLSVRELAAVLSTSVHHVDDRMVRRWEAGTRPVPPEVAAWMEAAADVPEPSPAWFQRPPLPLTEKS